MEPIAQNIERSWTVSHGSNSRPSEDECARQRLAKPSASRSVILRLTTPLSGRLLGQRGVDVHSVSVHYHGKKDYVVQGNGFSVHVSPCCTSRVELSIENKECQANDSDESTTTEHGGIKKDGEGSVCYDACQENVASDIKHYQSSDKEFILKSRLSTETFEQRHSKESCHQRGVRDRSLSSDSASVDYEMTNSCEKPGRVSSSREAFSVGPAILEHERPDCEEKPNVGRNCNAAFARKSSLAGKQERSQTGEKQHPCLTCGRIFTTKQNLLRHERTHTGEKLHRCTVCGKTFVQKRDLVGHRHVHTGESPHQCSVCGKMFTRKTYILRHERIHTGEKPYQCTVCGKAFSVKESLTRHSKLHTGEKPYQCSVCGTVFARKEHLVVHERIHTGEKPYQCTVCGKALRTKHSLVKHGQIHTGEK